LSDFIGNSHPRLLQGGVVNGAVAGLFCANILVNDQLSDYLRIGEEALPEYVSSVEIFAYQINSCFRALSGQGVGYKLINAINEDVVEKLKIQANVLCCLEKWKQHKR
jgi:hypothetical protein